MCDLFRSEDVRRVLSGKHVVLLGDSNIRGIYKDIIWLMNDNSFIPYECLSAKGEKRFDILIFCKLWNQPWTISLWKYAYSGDLNSELVQYSNGPKQFVPWMACYLSHVWNSELIVWYLNGKKFKNRMAFGHQHSVTSPAVVLWYQKRIYAVPLPVFHW